MTHSQVLDRPLNRTAIVTRPVLAPRGIDVPELTVPRPDAVRPDAARDDAARDDAFSRTLYERHGTVLLSFAVRLCDGDRHRAEDVVQETAVRAWQHQGILDPTTDRVRTWLFTVAHRIAIDHHRARLARPKEVGEEEPPDSAAPDPADRVVTLRVVLEAMAELTEGQREVLIYTYYLGYSMEQTARELGLALGTVKSRVHYSIRALREALRDRAMMD
jgi:RNA polymerase sigma-70 factor (ECF subfamily)